jgi:Tol biopolymer transport system component
MLRIILAALVVAFYCPAAAQAQQELPKQLTAGYLCGYPDWSPDGELIVFTSEWSETEEGNLWVIPAAGGERVRLTEHGGHHGVFSPDSKYIAFDTARGSIVQVIPASGGVPIRIVPESIPVEHSGNPCWSPDGSRIAFRSLETLYVLDLPSGSFSEVLSVEGHAPMPIQWLNTEDSIIASFVDPAAREAELWKVGVADGEAVQLTFNCHCTQATVSPDGALLVYSATTDGEDWDLWAMPTAGGEPLALTSGPEWDMEPCWSPAGDRIVFKSTRGGSGNLWLMDIDRARVEEQLRALSAD